MPKIAITDYFEECSIEKEILGDLIGLGPDNDTEILIVWHENIDESYIKKFPNIRAIQRYGVGYDTLDLEYLQKKNILCCNNPDYGVDEVSDTAMSFILSIARGLYKYNSKAKTLKDTWQEHVDESIKRSKNLNIGVIGAGRIGGSVLLKSQVFGFQTHFYDPYKESGYEKVFKAKRHHHLHDLLNVSDIITLHCPLNKETTSMVDEDFLKHMKNGSSLVNTARGGLISSLDLIYDSLLANKLDQVALDVLKEEPPSRGKLIDAWRESDPLVDGRITINPHTSYFSQESYREIRINAALNALRLFKKEKPLNVISLAQS